MGKPGESLRNVAKVSFGTLGSRILGLVRDMLTMAYLGSNAVSSAFIFGFTIPNLFRRLMGEGALSSAFIPIFAHTLKDRGKDEAFGFLNRALTRVAIILMLLTLAGAGISLACHFAFASGERYVLGTAFATFMMPYMIFICLAAVLCGALNVMGAFAIPALNAVWLNIALISSTLIGWLIYGSDIVSIAKSMCVGALLGGFAQFIIPAWELRRKGWRYRPDFGRCDAIGELFRLFLPALVGAGVIQLNMLVINTLALVVDDSAVSSIYVSSRLVELPLGMFTIAIITVYFPKLSMLSKADDAAGYSKEYAKGLVSIMFISLPAALGLFALREDILGLLFQWKNFGSSDVGACAPILAISALAIPFYSLATYSTRGFHSLKDTKTPVKISALAFFVNLGAALALMGHFGAKGLVAANLISALFQSALLNMSFRKRRSAESAIGETAKCLVAATVMFAFICAARPLMPEFADAKISAAINCAAFIPAGAAVYMLSLAALRFKGFREILKILRKER